MFSPMADQESLIQVAVVPFPAQSHLNQLLQLSHTISSSYKIKVHYIASSLHIDQVKSRATSYSIEEEDSKNLKIEFHSLETPEFLSPPPKNPYYPCHLMPSFEATTNLREPVISLISSLSAKTARLVLIHDTLMSHVVQDVGSLENVEPYFFHCISATYLLSFLPGFDIGENNIAGESLPSPYEILDPDFLDFLERTSVFQKTIKRAGVLVNTSRMLEGRCLNLFAEKERESNPGLKVWAIDPMKTVTLFKKKSALPNLNSGHKCLEWLDRQEARSVLYVSFGTTTFMVDDQIEELAKGLEEGGAKFIWVLRDADKGNVFEEGEARKHRLPLGFEERIARTGMGIVVRDWVPQMEILGHPSTGGFLSHCGWNSILESLVLGVPLLTWAIHTDQPINAFLVTRILKAGFIVREWMKRDELASSLVIGEAIKSLMSSVEGEEVRKRAEELGCELRKCTEEGGVSCLELDAFIAHISRH